MYRSQEKHPRVSRGTHFCAQDGFAVMGATVFAGLFLLVIAFSLLAQYGLMARIGPGGISLTVVGILALMAGVHNGLGRIKSRRFRTGVKDPLFMRAFMQSCYVGDCDRLERVLADRQKTPPLILNDLLNENMQGIIQTDAQYMVDVQDIYKHSRLKKNSQPVMNRFFHTPEGYTKASLPEEIEHIIQAVTTKYPQLKPELDSMLAARAHLCTLMGDYLELMPPSAHHVTFIKRTYRYHPPDDETTRRIAFALDTLKLLEAYTKRELRGERLARHGRLAAERIPLLAAAVSQYKAAFETLVKAYETVPADQTPNHQQLSPHVN